MTMDGLQTMVMFVQVCEFTPCCPVLYRKNTTWVGMNSRHTSSYSVSLCCASQILCFIQIEGKTLQQHLCKGIPVSMEVSLGVPPICTEVARPCGGQPRPSTILSTAGDNHSVRKPGPAQRSPGQLPTPSLGRRGRAEQDGGKPSKGISQALRVTSNLKILTRVLEPLLSHLRCWKL